jgi:hypothetical protein
MPVFYNHGAMESAFALFDDTHGQHRWRDTGFSSREAHTIFSGIADLLSKLGTTCRTTQQRPIAQTLPGASIFIIPTATGTYDARRERWKKHSSALFTPEDISHILRFLQNGGSLLAFAYRFGDSFTQTNVCNLAGPLGCLLNDDAVIDLDQIQTQDPLRSQFSTTSEAFMTPWATHQVQTVLWRSMSTFTILPGAAVHPLVCSPGGRCITFNRTFQHVSFQALPIAVAGRYGAGRFVLFGGPHAFETGIFGLLSAADNAAFLGNVLRWLLLKRFDEPQWPVHTTHTEDQFIAETINQQWRDFCRVERQGSGEQLVSFVERMLRQSGILRAISRARWAP